MPPGGVQDVGEFGPYYVYQHGELVELPSMNIVRDYDYAYKVDEADLSRMRDDGWCGAFESSAVLLTKPLKSRSIIVITNNGWMRGEPTKHTWCIRIDVASTWREGMAPLPPEPPVHPIDESHPEVALHSGRHVLWPIAPERAINARGRWQEDPTLRNSRLVEVYVPSDSPFHYSCIPEAIKVSTAEPSTMRLAEFLEPCNHPSKAMNKVPTVPVIHFALPQNEARDFGLWSSNIVASGLQSRARKCFRELHFTAHDGPIGWNVLNEDEQCHIWDMLAQEALSTPGGVDSASFQMWCTLRGVCRQSRTVLTASTKAFMKEAVLLQLNAQQTLSLGDAKLVARLLIPRGMSSIALRGEIAYQTATFDVSALMSNSTHVYMRLRTCKPPQAQPPRPPPPPPRLRDLKRYTRNVPSASISLPTPKPERSSLRIGIKRSANDEHWERHLVSTNFSPCFTSIKLKMSQPQEPEPNATPAKLVRKDSSDPTTVAYWVKRAALPKRSIQSVVPKGKLKAKTDCINWVCCGACDKWRILPGGDYLSVHDIPALWYCDMHPSGITCEDPEDTCEEGEVTTAFYGAIEEDDDPEDVEAKRMRLSGTKAGKLRVSTRRTRSGGAGSSKE